LRSPQSDEEVVYLTTALMETGQLPEAIQVIEASDLKDPTRSELLGRIKFKMMMRKS
jgi:hypothetical protein